MLELNEKMKDILIEIERQTYYIRNCVEFSTDAFEAINNIKSLTKQLEDELEAEING